MSGDNIVNFEKFGSFYLSSTGENIPDDGLLECQNMRLTPYGALTSRKGISEFRNTGLDASSFYPIFSNGSTVYCVSAGVSIIYLWTSGTTFTSGGAVPSPTIRLVNGDLADDGKYYAPLGGASIIAIDSAGTDTTTGGLASSITDPLRYHQGRLFAVKIVAAQPTNVLYYTDVNTYTAWPTANNVVIGDSSTYITGVVSLGERLIIFKPDSVWVLYTSSTPSNWVLRRVYDRAGNLGSTSFPHINSMPILIENVIYFAHSSGLYATDGVNFKNLSDPFIKADFDAAGIGVSYVKLDIYTIYVRVNGKHYLYDTKYNTWSTLLTSNDTSLVTSVDLKVGNNPGVYWAPTNNSSNKGIYSLSESAFQDTYLAATSAIAKKARTKYFNFGNRWNIKRSLQIWAEAQGTVGSTPQYSITHYADSSSAGTSVTGTCNTNGEPFILQAEGPQYFKKMSLYFSSVATTALKLISMGAEIIVKEPVD